MNWRPGMSKFEFTELEAGTEFNLGPRTVTKAEIIEFAEEFDPAPFHLDEEAAKDSMLGGLCASGWHTCAITMRMMCDAYILGTNSLGSPGMDYCNWCHPVRPGDILTGKSVVQNKRISKSRPDVGIVEIKHQIFNQLDILVMEMGSSGFFRIKAA